MKRGIFFCFTLFFNIILSLSSCNRFELFSRSETPHHYNILREVTDTINADPNTALMMLQDFNKSMDISRLGTVDYYEYNILLAEARYKCNLENINISVLNNAMSYFDSLAIIHPHDKNINYQRSRVYYYKGTYEEEKENYKLAFVNYLESLKIIEKINFISNDNKINHFKGLVYVRLSDILYWLDANESAIDGLVKANRYFASEKDLRAMCRNNIIIAIMYGQNYNYDMAFKHLSIADSLLVEFDKNSPLKYDIERINASIMYNIGYKDEALKKMLIQYNTLEAEYQRMEAAGVLGDIYYEKGILDSAIFYYKQYFPDNTFSNIDAANHIIEISLKTGNNELITKYAPILTEETSKELMLSTIKTELSSLYEQYKMYKHNHDIYSDLLLFLGIILLVTVIFFLLGMYLLRLKKTRYNKELNEKKYYINSLEEKINRKSSENKNIKIRIKNLENELHDLKTKKYVTRIPIDNKLNKIMEEPICGKLLDIAHDSSIKTNSEYPELQLSESEQAELITLFNKTFDKAFDKILSEHDNLKYQDVLYFCLYLIGLNEKQISAVTGKSYNIIYNRTKKIQKIFNSDKSIKEILLDLLPTST